MRPPLGDARHTLRGAGENRPLATPLKANGKRQDYVRARLRVSDGVLTVEPFALQDSSMQKVFAQADALIIRPVHAPPAASGDTVEVLLLNG